MCDSWMGTEKNPSGENSYESDPSHTFLLPFSEVNLSPSVYHINIHLDRDVRWDPCGAVIFNERFQGPRATAGKSAITKAHVSFINYKKIGAN